jgi:hypothetical protein
MNMSAAYAVTQPDTCMQMPHELNVMYMHEYMQACVYSYLCGSVWSHRHRHTHESGCGDTKFDRYLFRLVYLPYFQFSIAIFSAYLILSVRLAQ